MRYTYNGVDVTAAGFLDAEGTNYPANWALLASPEDRARVGIVETEDPVVEEPTPQPKVRFYPLEFLELFTEAEQLAVVSATLANAQVKLWYDKMLGASYVDITDPRTTSGLEALVGAGLLTEARKVVILTPVTE